MKLKTILAAILTVGAAAAAHAMMISPVTLTFEDYADPFFNMQPTLPCPAAGPYPCGGFTEGDYQFSNNDFVLDISSSLYGGPFAADPNGGKMVAINALPGSFVITRQPTSISLFPSFMFSDLWVKGGVNGLINLTGKVNGYDFSLPNNLVFSLGFNASTPWTHVLSFYDGKINELVVNVYNNEKILIDDVTLGDYKDLPEPSSLALLGLGIIGLIGSRRRKV